MILLEVIRDFEGRVMLLLLNLLYHIQLKKEISIYLFRLPLIRNRTQSYSDKLRTADTGTKVQGDAAFADYLINAGFAVRL